MVRNESKNVNIPKHQNCLGITQTPLRRLNGYRISPSESDESYNSGIFFLLNQGIINNTLIPDYSTCVTPSDVILNESKHSVQHNLHQASLNALDCKAEVPSTS